MTFNQKGLISKLMNEIESDQNNNNIDWSKYLNFAQCGFDTYKVSDSEASKDIEFLMNAKIENAVLESISTKADDLMNRVYLERFGMTYDEFQAQKAAKEDEE